MEVGFLYIYYALNLCDRLHTFSSCDFWEKQIFQQLPVIFVFTLYHMEFDRGGLFKDWPGIHYRNQQKIWIQCESSIRFKIYQYIVSRVRAELNIQQAIGMAIIFPDDELLPVPILHVIFKVVLI